MLDALIWLVTFSSPYHQAWFLMSMFILIASCLSVKLGCRRHLPWVALFHGIVAFEALLWITLRPGENQVYSVHCIWFNGLMFAVYYFLTGSRGTEKAEAEAAERKAADEQAAEEPGDEPPDDGTP